MAEKKQMESSEKETMLDKNTAKILMKTGDTYTKTYKEKHVAKTRCKLLAGCLVAFNLILMVCLLTLVIKWREERINSLKPREQTVCVDCEDLGVVGKVLPDKLKGKISMEQKEDQEGFVCCGKTSAVLNGMVSKSITDREDAYSRFSLFETPECKKTKKEVPTAQMNGISMSKISKGLTEVIHWNTSGPSFTKGGIKYSNGRLSSNQTGFYYIFSQIKVGKCQLLQIKTDKDYGTVSWNDHHSGRLDHFMYRRSSGDGKTQKILESSRSSCEITSSSSETTSSIGAVFYLEKNDEVFVNTSHPECLLPSIEGNHFGLYLT